MTEPRRPVIAVIEQSNAYQSRIIEGVRSVLQEARTPLLLVSNDPLWTEVPPSLRRAIAAVRPAGVITTTLFDSRADAALRTFLGEHPELATVHLGCLADENRPGPTTASGSTGSALSVKADNSAGMRQVVRHLVEECGVSRPAVVRGHLHQVDSQERERIVREELAHLSVELDEDLVLDGAFERDRAHRELRGLLERRRDFDAVIAFNDRMALGVLDALRLAGLRVPEDVAVTGFDDEDVATLSNPPLTSVSQQIGEQGALAARLLLQVLDGGSPAPMTVPTRLVVRGSTRPMTSARSLPAPRTPADEVGLPAGAVEEKDVSAITDRLWREVTILDTSLAMTRGFSRCRSSGEVVERFAAALPRLGVRRCFFVLFYQPRSAKVAMLRPDARLIGRLVLVQRDGVLRGARGSKGWAAPFDVAGLLPDHLAGELSDGTLMLQPLSTESGELGYLLLELSDPDRFVGDAIRRDLCRTLDLLARNAELAEHAQDLERLVELRTAELRSEVATRRGAEESLRRLNEELRSQLHVDGLTGITNRVGFDVQLARQWSAHSRSNSPLSLLMVDVDHFKRFNDSYGHLAGDECLRVLARCLGATVRRPNDVAARYGGEEFAVILPNTDPEGARALANRLRQLLAEAAVAHTASPHGVVTVSIGAATAYPDPSPNATSLIADADVALYAAKAAGRDRVVSAEGGVLTG